MRIPHLVHTMALRALAEPRDDAAASPTPPHQVVNYAGMLKWSIWALTIVSAIFLGLRVYCKLTRHRALWWDDYFLIFSWVSAAFIFLVHPRLRC